MGPRTIQIAIVEDSKEDLDNCLDLLDKYSKENNLILDISTFESGDAFLLRYASQYDFIILDINLSAIDGISVARTIREKDEDVIIMFVTNLAKYVTRGYEVSAIDYAIKPLNYNSFAMKLNRVLKRINNKSDNFIFIPKGGGGIKANLNSILYIEVIAHDVVFHMLDGNEETHGSLKIYEEKLKPYWFIRCNSCYLVNARMIKKIDKLDIYLINDEIIHISHPKHKEFLKNFKLFVLQEGK